MAGTLKAVDAEEVDAHLYGGLRVLDCRAFVQYDAVVVFEFLNHSAWRVAGRLDDLDALVDDDLGVCAVVWWVDGWEEGKVYTKRLVGHSSAFADFFA